MESDKYQFLDEMGTSAEAHVFWQLLKRMLENADGLNAGMLMLNQHLGWLQRESRLPRSSTIVQQPLTEQLKLLKGISMPQLWLKLASEVLSRQLGNPQLNQPIRSSRVWTSWLVREDECEWQRGCKLRCSSEYPMCLIVFMKRS